MTILCAELGINHNGSFGTLLEMADTALEHFDYVKTQMRTPELCVPRDQWNKPRMWKGKLMTYMEYKQLMEFSVKQYDEFDKKYKGKWTCSVWDMEALERASRYDLPFIKIPSAKITDLDLVAEAAGLFPIVLSTGMSTNEQIRTAVRVAVANAGDKDITLLHCTSTYPTKDSEVNLRGIETLQDNYVWDASVGFSSHSKSPYPAIYAILLNASFLEVHFTLDRTMEGTDQSASLEAPALELIAREAQKIPILLGDGRIQVYESEQEPMKKLRG